MPLDGGSTRKAEQRTIWPRAWRGVNAPNNQLLSSIERSALFLPHHSYAASQRKEKGTRRFLLLPISSPFFFHPAISSPFFSAPAIRVVRIHAILQILIGEGCSSHITLNGEWFIFCDEFDNGKTLHSSSVFEKSANLNLHPCRQIPPPIHLAPKYALFQTLRSILASFFLFSLSLLPFLFSSLTPDRKESAN
ncbi:PAP/OAS1 substrate-binding domain superfamily [Striga asiatica]|uniref:PAP/OAS1 substrate-binding domain superfamily n=1 Tax=Striga asiatica TaxID=4170 RepID=A0A5A7PQB5_STRAF|nr:PAP/OAS1 substrate-binding domain superfamily [Striga asiatica]